MSTGLNRRFVFWVAFFETTVLSIAVMVLVNAWYPGNYFDLLGIGYKLAGFLAALFVLGPVLGALFYKPDGEAYANDLSVIFIVKFVVLMLGLHLAYSQRPILVVFSVDRFVVVQAYQISLDQAPPAIVKMTVRAGEPPLIAARKLPENDAGPLLEIMSGGVDIEYRPAQYERFEYQQEGFRQRICYSDLESDYEGSNFREDCESVPVPLVYKRDRYATAIFDSGGFRIQEVLVKDPW